MNKISGITNVCFDIDGTLISHSATQNDDTLRLLGFQPNEEFNNQVNDFWDTINKKLQNGKPVTKDYLCYQAYCKITALKKFGISAEKWLQAASDADVITLKEGADEILEYLTNSGYMLICCTNWFVKEQVKILKDLGIFHYFEKIYGWDTICAKPHRRALGTFTQDVGSEYIVLVGDSVNSDIVFANRLGMRSIGLNLKYNKRNKKVLPTVSIDSLLEIKKYL